MRIDFQDWPRHALKPDGPGMPFVILFTGRTGTTFATDVLNQHPLIRCEGEWLATFKNEADGPARQEQWINDLFSDQNFYKYRAVGFKTKFFDIPDKDGFSQMLANQKPRVIVSYRANVVKQAISALRIKAHAEKKKQRLKKEEWERTKQGNRLWNIFKGDTGLGISEIDIDEAKNQIAILDRSNRELLDYVQSLNMEYFFYDYEDMLRDRDAFFSKFFGLLGVGKFSYEVNVIKHTSDDLSETISNFAELKAAFAGSQYESMFSS